MSQYVFPSALPGLDVKVSREVSPHVYVQAGTSRRETRVTWETAPLTRYKVDFNVLRADSTVTGRAREWQTVLSHLARHFGQLDSFLLLDPADSSTTSELFAQGDGTTSTFQLQRSLADTLVDPANPKFWPLTADGYEPTYDLASPPTIYQSGDWPGTRKLYPYPRTNLLPWSDSINSGGSSFTVTAGSTVTANVTTAPDGTATADQFNEGAPPTPPTLNTVTTSATGGTLAAGTYYVKVSATLNGEESLQGNEISVTTTGTTSTVTASWTASPTATAYRAWLGTAPGVYDHYQVTSSTSFTFNAPAATGPATPLTTTNRQHYTGIAATGGAEQVGELRCHSVFVKANTVPNIRFNVLNQDEGIKFNLATGAVDGITGSAANVLASGVIVYPAGWYRIWFTRRTPAGGQSTGLHMKASPDAAYGTTFTGTGRSFYFWRLMSERVSDLNGPSTSIKSPGASAGTAPAEYFVDGTGKVTLTAPPPVGTSLTWDGSYYRRVRFEQDSITTDRLAAAMYEAKSVRLITVVP